MKQSIKGFVAGFLVCSLLSATAVFAAGGIMKEIFYGVNVVVDGEKLEFTDDTKPFTMDGRTFLPVSAISSALGKSVDWDGNTKTVIIGAPSPANEAGSTATIKAIKLTDLKPTRESKYVKHDMIKDKFEGVYRDCPTLFDNGYVEFFLDKKYTKLTLIIAPDDEYFNVEAESILSIDGDNKNLYTSDAITYKTRPITIEIDVSGQDYITLTHKTSRGWTRLILGNSTLS